MNTKINFVLIPLSIAIVSFYCLRGCDKKIDKSTDSTVLGPGVVGKFIVNPDTRKLTVVLPSGQQELFLPDRPSSIEIGKDGKIVVTAKKWGSEIKVFGGGQVTDSFRLVTGLDLLYYKKLDLGLGIACRIGNYPPRGFGKISYNFWSNLQAGVTFDTEKKAGLALTVRF